MAGEISQLLLSVSDTKLSERLLRLERASQLARSEIAWVLVLKSSLACDARSASLTTRITALTVWVSKTSVFKKKNDSDHIPDTYNAPYNLDEGHSDKPMKDRDGNQIFSQGGYSSHSRVHERFVFPIPDNIPSHEAGPMMCAGLTTYSPLVRAGCGPGKKVAILGIGGLGHFGILWAKALGAEVWALSHTPGKKAEALKLGADHFVSTGDKDWAKPLAFTFNFILNCADMTNEFDLSTYMSTLAVNGEFHNVGLPDKPLPQMMAQDFAPNGAKIAGSHIGSRPEALAMLKLASEKGLHPMIETMDISEAGCKKAVEKVNVNDVRYRITLTGFHKAFGTKP